MQNSEGVGDEPVMGEQASGSHPPSIDYRWAVISPPPDMSFFYDSISNCTVTCALRNDLNVGKRLMDVEIDTDGHERHPSIPDVDTETCY
jgi:hypothetical protein